MQQRHKIVTPSQLTACSYNADGSLLGVGSDDGSVRLYRTSDMKLVKAVRALTGEVSDILFRRHQLRAQADDVEGSFAADIWIAAGQKLFNFDLSASKLVLSADDARNVVSAPSVKPGLPSEHGEDSEDSVNKMALSANQDLLACTTDDGGVYVLDLSTNEICKMKVGHSSIAWNVSFVPNRPNELLSGGYDCTLLHFDARLRTLLSRLEIEPSPTITPGFASPPPFITAMTISPLGTLAVGTGDGRIFIGIGGSKVNASNANMGKKKKKRSRKWEGLSETAGFCSKVADAMIVGIDFVDEKKLVSCTVYGQIASHVLDFNSSPNDGIGSLSTVLMGRSACPRVDSFVLRMLEDPFFKLTVAGTLENSRQGAFEVWEVSRKT